MIDTRRIQEDIQRLYARDEDPGIDIPLALQAAQMVYLAKDYMAAASIVDSEAPQHWLPVLQLTGHAVEIALKACLASKDVRPGRIHDLVELYRQAEQLGFELSEPEFAAIVHLQHFYYADHKTGTKFKARYPTERNERLGGAIPRNSTFRSIVNLLIEQVAQADR